MPASPYTIVGYPEDVAGADALAEREKYQFQWWAVIRPAATGLLR